MERTGIAVDRPYLDQLEELFATECVRRRRPRLRSDRQADQYRLPKQLQVVLFDELDMPKTKRTKTGYTTDADALESLYEKTEHPFLRTCWPTGTRAGCGRRSRAC